MENKKLIEEIVEKVMLELKRAESPDSFNKKRVLVLITGGDKRLYDVKASIDRIAEKSSISIIFSEAFVKLFGKDYIEKNYGKYEILDITLNETKALVPKYDAVVIPVLTRNTCAKVAGGTCDTIITNLITFALIGEKQIIACEESCILSPNMKYNGFVVNNMEKLKELGIRLIKIEALHETLFSLEKEVVIGKRVLTEEDIAKYENSVLFIDKKTLITDLAFEKAKSKGITISHMK